MSSKPGANSTKSPKLQVVDRHLPTRRPAMMPEGPRDIRRTKEYKAAARRWTATIVALPIALYTSYILYDRTYGSKSTVHEKPWGKGSGSDEDR